MVEYGNGVGEVAGRAGGGGGLGGQPMDVGASLSRFVNESAHTISTMPPAYLLIGVVAIFIFVMMVKRAF